GFTLICAGEKTSCLIVTSIVAALAGAAAIKASDSAASGPAIRKVIALFQLVDEHLRVLLMALENLEAGREQILELRIFRVGDQRVLERAVDRLVKGEFVRRVGLIESGAGQLRELLPLGRRLLHQRLAGVVVLGRDFQLLDQR